MDKVNIWW